MSFRNIKESDFFYPAKDYGENTIVLVQMPELIKYKTAEKYYGASRSKLQELVEEAGAECKIGKAVWIDRSILEDFMRAHNTRRGIGRY